MLIGPIFAREAMTAPRRGRHYLSRSMYGAVLFVVMWTAWQIVVGFQRIESAGDTARFGAVLFQLLAIIQLLIGAFFAPVVTGSSIATEKDRRTFVLLMMTDLHNREIVLGKLLASILQLVVLLACGLPVFAISLLLGGASGDQIARVYAVTISACFATGSVGVLIASWRDRMFQALALTLLIIVLYLALVEAGCVFIGEDKILGIGADGWRALLNPYFSVQAIVDPLPVTQFGWIPGGQLEWGFVLLTVTVTLMVIVVSVVTLRRWNTGGERAAGPREVDEEEEKRLAAAAPKINPKVRSIWANPILWREIRTRAYGRRPLLVKAAYFLACGLILIWFLSLVQAGAPVGRMDVARALVPVLLIGMILANVQAVSSITSEKDGRSLDLLLVSDITPKEFIFGKLFGVLFNVKEMVLLPLALCVYLLLEGYLGSGGSGWENGMCLIVAALILFLFSCTLGIHASLSYETTRAAVVNSLGTIVFLFIGIMVCIFLIVISGTLPASGKFKAQATSFVVFICAGAVALYASLAVRNQSTALAITAFLCPALTWWSIAHLSPWLLSPRQGGDPLGAFIAIAISYGFAILSMLVPAVSEFDVALGRTVSDE